MFLSSYWLHGMRVDVTVEHISRALKQAATELQYPAIKGSPIDSINTHSLRSGGANALAPKKWGGGVGPLSKNIFGKNWHVMRRACLGT